MSLASIIRSAYKQSKYTSAKECHSATQMPVNYFTFTKTLAGEDKLAVHTFIAMAYALKIPISQIAEACKDAGGVGTIFYKILTDKRGNSVE